MPYHCILVLADRVSLLLGLQKSLLRRPSSYTNY